MSAWTSTKSADKCLPFRPAQPQMADSALTETFIQI